MNFGPDWIRNLPSEGSTGGGTAGGTKYQLAEFRYENNLLYFIHFIIYLLYLIIEQTF